MAAQPQHGQGGAQPFQERFKKEFDSANRDRYNADDWAKDIREYIDEIGFSHNWSFKHRRRAVRMSLKQDSAAFNFIDKSVPELWLKQQDIMLDLEDGKGAVNHEPWEVIVYLIEKNYGPDPMAKDFKTIAEFEQIRYTPGTPKSDFIAAFEEKREKAQ